MPDRPTISIIAAMSENHVIGINGGLPWRLPDEMKHFVRLTTGHTITMGRRTFEEVGSKPLPNRRNIILSRNPDFTGEQIEVAGNLTDAIASIDPDDTAFICGGEQVYRDALPIADHLYLTLVHAEVQGDARFPDFDVADWALTDQTRHEPDTRHAHAFTFYRYERRR